MAIARRRHLAASGPLPPSLACKFTVGELAALRIVSDEVREKGHCGWTLGEIAARAGIGRTTAQNAMRAAAAMGLITVQERRREGQKNLPNVVRVVSREWQLWIKRGGQRNCPQGVKPIGFKKTDPTDKDSREEEKKAFPRKPLRPESTLDTPGRSEERLSAKPGEFDGKCGVEFLNRERAIVEDWYPVRLAPRNGTPVILWIEDDEAPPTYPVTVGVWGTDDMMGLGHWRVFGDRYGTHIYFDRHVVGWRPLPRIRQSRGG